MFIGARILLHGRYVDAAFVREGRLAHIRCMPVGRLIQHLVENARGMGQRAEFLGRDLRFETIRIGTLEQQRGHDRREVRVTAALTEPVERALNLPRAGPHRRQRIGDAVIRVVVHMNADVIARDMRDDVRDDGLDLFR